MSTQCFEVMTVDMFTGHCPMSRLDMNILHSLTVIQAPHAKKLLFCRGKKMGTDWVLPKICLLYTSDAADE